MMRATCLFLAFAVAAGCESRIDVPTDTLVVRNATVIDGTGAPPLPDGVVVIQGERILAVGPAADFRIPEEVKSIDAGGGTVIPGLFNAHVHHGAPAELRRRFLLEGVTSVCDLGSTMEEMEEFLAMESDEGPAARGFRAGPIVTAPGGYPDGLYGTRINYEVAGPEEARAGIAELAARGVDMIKIAVDPSWNFDDPIPSLDLETTRAIVEEAHRHGLRVRTHLIQPPQMELAVEAGVDVIEHLAMPRWPSREEEDSVMAAEDPVGFFFQRWAPDYQPLLERMAAQGTAMVPTLSAVIGGFYTAEDPTPRQAWVARVVMDIPRRLHDLGGVIAVGNDFNDRATKERLPLLEMEMLLAAGLSPMDVIVAATKNSAMVCGQGEELGTLETGKLADLLVLEGDPLTDLVGAVQRVALVVRGGVVTSPGG
jgi:imidazolonepropionase-like amidohydrolase